MNPDRINLRTEIVDVVIGGTTYHLERVADIDPLLNSITPEEFEKDERLPYWAQLWSSSVALSRYLDRKIPVGKSFLEIGAGLGLASAVASEKFLKVLCTDYESGALAFAERNAKRNKVRIDRMKFEMLDWRDDGALGKFDVIAASDILYEKRSVRPVLRFLQRHVGTAAVVADPNRSTADGFFRLAEDSFVVEIESEEVHLDGITTSVRVALLTHR